MSKLKRDIQSILHPRKIEDLHPPTAPKSMVSGSLEIGAEGLNQGVLSDPQGRVQIPYSDLKPTIDFNKIANASEFQRFVYWILTGETFRGSTKALKMKIRHTSEKINMVRGLPPDILKELKEVLKKRNEP